MKTVKEIKDFLKQERHRYQALAKEAYVKYKAMPNNNITRETFVKLDAQASVLGDIVYQLEDRR